MPKRSRKSRVQHASGYDHVGAILAQLVFLYPLLGRHLRQRANRFPQVIQRQHTDAVFVGSCPRDSGEIVDVAAAGDVAFDLEVVLERLEAKPGYVFVQ